VDSLAELEQAALRGAPEQTQLTVMIEPTGPRWLPIAPLGHMAEPAA
jgi:hypothetical protein